jgi:predicted  nucleic acid-binding Zn-ribbon protein
MSGMKFRLQCASCGTTFFGPDRKTRYCPKCLKKRAGKAPVETEGVTKPRSAAPRATPATPRATHQPNSRAGSNAIGVARAEMTKSPPKSHEMTAELRERIEQIYRERFAGSETAWRDMVAHISDQVWLNRKVVSAALHEIVYPMVPITPEMESRIIDMYRGYVERGERPENGRRRTIGQELGVPFHQVRNIVYHWAQSQYTLSPVPDLSREQRFAIEKLYWEELGKQRYHLNDLPAKITEELGFVNSFQVCRWLDTLHDDDVKFMNVPDVTPEQRERIIEAYQQYLASPKPPELGLHSTIASQIGGLATRQVHKVLQAFRKQQRANYPLQK